VPLHLPNQPNKSCVGISQATEVLYTTEKAKYIIVGGHTTQSLCRLLVTCPSTLNILHAQSLSAALFVTKFEAIDGIVEDSLLYPPSLWEVRGLYICRHQ